MRNISDETVDIVNLIKSYCFFLCITTKSKLVKTGILDIILLTVYLLLYNFTNNKTIIFTSGLIYVLHVIGVCICLITDLTIPYKIHRCKTKKGD